MKSRSGPAVERENIACKCRQRINIDHPANDMKSKVSFSKPATERVTSRKHGRRGGTKDEGKKQKKTRRITLTLYRKQGK